jgi:hypothetical protein
MMFTDSVGERSAAIATSSEDPYLIESGAKLLPFGVSGAGVDM